jgi:hypothetical protein
MTSKILSKSIVFSQINTLIMDPIEKHSIPSAPNIEESVK